MTPDRWSCRGVTPGAIPGNLDKEMQILQWNCAFPPMTAKGAATDGAPTDLFEGGRLQKYLLIAIGGALGSVARYWVGSSIASRMGIRFPYGTLIVNITACVVIGFSMTYLGRRAELNPAWRYSGAGRVYRGVQHVLDLRVGNTVDPARRGFRNRRTVCGGQFYAGACGCLGRVGAGRDGAVAWSVKLASRDSLKRGRKIMQKQILHSAYPTDFCPWGPKTLRSG